MNISLLKFNIQINTDLILSHEGFSLLSSSFSSVTLLKKEFDYHRTKDKVHPLIEKYGVDAKPVPHEDLDNWRNNFVGVQYLHKPTNLLIFGAIDDLWINSKDKYIVVDYKATSKNEEITKLDKDWHEGYKRQMEIYQCCFVKTTIKFLTPDILFTAMVKKTQKPLMQNWSLTSH
jgi:hypothetical protein